MDLGIEGKVALVTGASKGLGLGVATALANEGATVAIASRSEERIQSAADQIGARAFVHDTAAAGRRPRPMPCPSATTSGAAPTSCCCSAH
jgi:NAD(P)-dependent dehydrogenase (short-subunit alcohol dehydrogenase family)